MILIRAVQAFREEQGFSDHPAIIAGGASLDPFNSCISDAVDLNTQPNEATYHLLTSLQTSLRPEHLEEISSSRLIHTSLQNISIPTHPASTTTSDSASGTATPAEHTVDDDDDDDDSEKEEHSRANTREAVPEDGLLSPEELHELAKSIVPPLHSAYAATKHEFATYGSRSPSVGAGDGEPAYTCYTPLYKLTLGGARFGSVSLIVDYLFILPPVGVEVGVTQLLRPSAVDELGEGLPRRGISASDHIAVGCEIAWLTAEMHT